MLMKEHYYIQNSKTKLYLKGFDRTKPLWVEQQKQAAIYSELDALKLQRRLENLYAPAQSIILVEKD